jgi:hypothetical protein
MIGRVADRLRDRLRAQSGVVLVMSALLLPVFMGMVGFGVDFGWLYWNGLKIQHGADAAALAGVIYEPDNQSEAYAQAEASAAENGYDGTDAGTTVTPVDFADDASAVNNPNQLRVTISHNVPTFFMRVFGITNVSITKTAVAEYVLPLPLGSPEPEFGNDPTTGHAPEFWGNIHGYYTGRRMGDRFASQCLSGGSGSGCTPNPERRPTVYTPPTVGSLSSASGGYVYALDVLSGGTVTLQVFDGQFTRGGGDQVLVGDNPQGGDEGPTTVFILYDSDPTPLDTSDNTVLCYEEFEPRDALMPSADGSTTFAEYDAYLQANGPIADPKGDIDELSDLWDPICTQNLAVGTYPVRVLIKDGDRRGLNRWSMKATGASARIFGLGDMAIYSNVDGSAGNTVFYLAEVDPVHAGKDLVISLWDPGDASGNHSMRVRPPVTVNGGAPFPCTWASTNSSYPGGSLGSCDIPTSNSRFNDHLVEIRVDIPADYTCTPGGVPGCWWRIDYNYPSQTNDTTTWSARIEGNPVKLVE